MGFRSDVYIKCSTEKVFEFKKFMNDYKTKFDDDLQQTGEFYSDDDYLYLILRDWKFYSGYPEVGFITDFVEREGMEEYIGMITINEDYTKDEWGSPWEVDLNAYMEIEGV